MKIVASVSVEYNMSDFETLDDAKDKVLEKLVDSLEDWLIYEGLPPIISLEYKIPDNNNDDPTKLNLN
tara:strand:- start:531 stop:734 length:204 start_codon:yes stop_codon:yes gene_type:complete